MYECCYSASPGVYGILTVPLAGALYVYARGCSHTCELGDGVACVGYAGVADDDSSFGE